LVLFVKGSLVTHAPLATAAGNSSSRFLDFALLTFAPLLCLYSRFTTDSNEGIDNWFGLWSIWAIWRKEGAAIVCVG